MALCSASHDHKLLLSRQMKARFLHSLPFLCFITWLASHVGCQNESGEFEPLDNSTEVPLSMPAEACGGNGLSRKGVQYSLVFGFQSKEGLGLCLINYIFINPPLIS